MSDNLALLFGSLALYQLGAFVAKFLLFVLATRALIVVPRELAAIRRALDRGDGGAGGTRPDTGTSRPEAPPAAAPWAATSPLGRL